MNLAAAWKLPVIFVCENNQKAISVDISESSAVTNLPDRASGYGMPGYTVCGQDVEAVRSTMAKAVHDARNGRGPSFIECKTERFCDHCGITYPFMDEKQFGADVLPFHWKYERDPITMYAAEIYGDQFMNAGEFSELYRSVQDEINEAVLYAEESPDPDISDLPKDMFFDATV